MATRRQTAIKKTIRERFPLVSLADFQGIEEIANRGHLRHLPPSVVVVQAVTTYIRHNHTQYDQYLAEGYDSDSARFFVIDEMMEIAVNWGGSLEHLRDYDLPNG